MLGMRLSARADYALRAAVELAASSGDHTTAEQLARAQNIPAKFLEAILTQLRRAGLVRSQRGPEGGFWLARPAAEISLADIIRAVDGQLVGVRGERPENLGYIGAAEPLQSVWIALRANERAILDEVTLDHIVTGELPPPDPRAHRRPPRLGLTQPPSPSHGSEFHGHGTFPRYARKSARDHERGAGRVRGWPYGQQAGVIASADEQAQAALKPAPCR